MRTQTTEREQKSAAKRGVTPLLLEVIPFVIQELRSGLKRIAKNKITVPQFRILATVHITPSNMKDLSGAVGMSLPATSRMVKMMGNKGWLEFSKGLSDKREIKIRLSRKGFHLHQSIHSQISSVLEDRLNFLSQDDSLKITTGLLALKKALNDLRLKEN